MKRRGERETTFCGDFTFMSMVVSVVVLLFQMIRHPREVRAMWKETSAEDQQD